jgi:hypothetical protein
MKTLASTITATVVLLVPAVTHADIVRVERGSQQVTPERARIGASVRVTTIRPAARRPSITPGGGSTRHTPATPTLPENSTLARDRTPGGPGTFWYDGHGADRCIYIRDSSPACYRITSGGQRKRVDPAEIAAGAAKQLALTAGEIRASPSTTSAGLTGWPSWFWLDGTSPRATVTASAGSEHVTVTATPSDIAWSFGDDRTVHAGRGVPYGSGRERDAVRHGYRTRCLPGDQGHNPYVLDSCGDDGYRVRAVVTWSISYRSTGPVSESGSLPARTTETAIAYPVSEARGFLTGGRRS